MRVLVLGGGDFVGRAIVDDAVARGWHVTALNRGRSDAHPATTALVGDRRAPEGLDALGDGEWDLVVDTWSWAPSVVRDSATALAGRAGHYSYISSRSVYAYPTAAGADETAPVVEASAGAGDGDYTGMKAGGELAVTESFHERALLIRAGLILGPRENIGRLPWWLGRMARGGDVLVPGPPDLTMQYVDARDLAAFTLDAAARGLGGAYNVVSEPGATTMRQAYELCATVTGSRSVLHWADPDFLLAQGVEPWTQLPFWLPPGEAHDTLHRADVSKALAAGLTIRLLAETVEDTWLWLQRIGGVEPLRPDRPPVGLDPEVEARLLSIHGRP